MTFVLSGVEVLESHLVVLATRLAAYNGILVESELGVARQPNLPRFKLSIVREHYL